MPGTPNERPSPDFIAYHNERVCAPWAFWMSELDIGIKALYFLTSVH